MATEELRISFVIYPKPYLIVNTPSMYPGLSKTAQNISKTYIGVTLTNFLVAAVLGLTLRYAFFKEIPWLNYKNVMHAHSHIAMLGWAFLILSCFVWRSFGDGISGRRYSNLFWICEMAVLGMLISFPLQGYGLYSILFSAVFLVTALIYLYQVFSILRVQRGPEILLLKTSIVWFFVSTCGVWALGPIVASGGTTTALYYMAIQFFLHFQFNGWFIFVVLALFFYHLRNLNISVSISDFKKFYLFLSISCILTFALAVTWADKDDLLFLGNSLGVTLQLIALFFFARILSRSVRTVLRHKMPAFAYRFYQVAFFSFLAKVLIQSVVIIPSIAIISYTIRLYVLGFIHLILLGAITTFILGYGFSTGVIDYHRRTSKAGWILLLSGFLLTEILLFGQGTMLWAGLGYLDEYYLLIFIFSALLPLGILLGLIGNIGKREIAINETVNV